MVVSLGIVKSGNRHFSGLVGKEATEDQEQTFDKINSGHPVPYILTRALLILVYMDGVV